jgi:hypothetical protein
MPGARICGCPGFIYAPSWWARLGKGVNLEAAEKGPASLGRWYVRRAAYRKTTSGLGGLLRALGLSGGRSRLR